MDQVTGFEGIDDEIVGMAMRVLRGIEVTEDSMAVEAIHRVGPGGHYLMDDHTVQFMRSELFRPPLADRQSRAMWEEAGRKDTRARAIARVEKLLQTHQLPQLPPEVDAAIRARFHILLQILACNHAALAVMKLTSHTGVRKRV